MRIFGFGVLFWLLNNLEIANRHRNDLKHCDFKSLTGCSDLRIVVDIQSRYRYSYSIVYRRMFFGYCRVSGYTPINLGYRKLCEPAIHSVLSMEAMRRSWEGGYHKLSTQAAPLGVIALLGGESQLQYGQSQFNDRDQKINANFLCSIGCTLTGVS